MAAPSNEKKDDRITGRLALTEIVAGYGLIFAVMSIMFLGASGIGLEIPWIVFTGVLFVGGILAVAVLRNRSQELK